MNKKLTTSELGRPSLDEYKARKRFPIVVVLDDIRSLANVGSIFRTCDGFNVEEVVLCGITGRPPHREIQRTALGATESVAWRYAEDAGTVLIDLKEQGYQLCALEQCEDSVDLEEWRLQSTRGVCLILGNEVEGVKQSLINKCDQALEITQFGTKHSLNVTVAAGIALWEIVRKLRMD